MNQAHVKGVYAICLCNNGNQVWKNAEGANLTNCMSCGKMYDEIALDYVKSEPEWIKNEQKPSTPPTGTTAFKFLGTDKMTTPPSTKDMPDALYKFYDKYLWPAFESDQAHWETRKADFGETPNTILPTLIDLYNNGIDDPPKRGQFLTSMRDVASKSSDLMDVLFKALDDWKSRSASP